MRKKCFFLFSSKAYVHESVSSIVLFPCPFLKMCQGIFNLLIVKLSTFTISIYFTFTPFFRLFGTFWFNKIFYGWNELLYRWNELLWSMLINQFVPPTFCFCFAFTGVNFRGICYTTFVTLPKTKTCVDQSELEQAGAQID